MPMISGISNSDFYGEMHMSKYDTLWKHIAETQPNALTFEDVERICGIPIDHSFLTYKKELEVYGFRVGKISMKKQTIVIERAG